MVVEGEERRFSWQSLLEVGKNDLPSTGPQRPTSTASVYSQGSFRAATESRVGLPYGSWKDCDSKSRPASIPPTHRGKSQRGEPLPRMPSFSSGAPDGAANPPRKHASSSVIEWRTFERAREFARKLRLEDAKAWNMWVAETNYRPRDIPSHPEEVYAEEGWRGFEDWLKEPPAAEENGAGAGKQGQGMEPRDRGEKDGAEQEEVAVKRKATTAERRWLMKGSGDCRLNDLLEMTGPRFRHHPHALKQDMELDLDDALGHYTGPGGFCGYCYSTLVRGSPTFVCSSKCTFRICKPCLDKQCVEIEAVEVSDEEENGSTGEAAPPTKTAEELEEERAAEEARKAEEAKKHAEQDRRTEELLRKMSEAKEKEEEAKAKEERERKERERKEAAEEAERAKRIAQESEARLRTLMEAKAREDAERLEREAAEEAEKERLREKEREERERRIAEKLDAAEQAAYEAEQDRIAAIAKARKEEEERVAAEKVERKREAERERERERVEQEERRKQAERMAEAEKEREREAAEAAMAKARREAEEKHEAEHARIEAAFTDRLAADAALAEEKRVAEEKHRVEQERIEREFLERVAAAEEAEKERKAEQERIEREFEARVAAADEERAAAEGRDAAAAAELAEEEKRKNAEKEKEEKEAKEKEEKEKAEREKMKEERERMREEREKEERVREEREREGRLAAEARESAEKAAKDEASRAKQRAEAIEFVRAGCSVEKYTHAGGGKPHKRFMAVKAGLWLEWRGGGRSFLIKSVHSGCGDVVAEKFKVMPDDASHFRVVLDNKGDVVVKCNPADAKKWVLGMSALIEDAAANSGE